MQMLDLSGTYLDAGGVFLAGLISFLSPCILPVIPVFVSTLIGSLDPSQKSLKLGRLRIYLGPILRVAAFMLGVTLTFAILGMAFGALGQLIRSFAFMLVCSIIVILLGVYQTGLISIPFLMRERKLELKSSHRKGVGGAFLLGFTYSFGWTPCIGPVFAAVLSYTANQGAVMGIIYLLIYSVGFLLPFLVFTVFSDVLLDKIKGIYRHMKAIKIAGGVIIIAMGIYLLISSFGYLK